MKPPSFPEDEALLASLLRQARSQLSATAFAAPREAALLLGHVLGLSEAQVLARDDRPLSPQIIARFKALLARRIAGEPVAYLVGEREFYGRRFAVDRRVLIPRPETEHLVEAVLGLPLPSPPRILDVATGSGCIAVTLALELPASRVVASDLSPGALAVAAFNAHALGAARVRLVGSDLARAFDLRDIDVVVSNPPYIDPADAGELSPEVRDFEPHLALFSPGQGDSTLERLFMECRRLMPGAWVVVEIGFGQSERVRQHAAAAGLRWRETRCDYAGVPRVIILQQP